MPGEIDFKFERLAEFIVNNAEEFSQCLPLLKETFQALTVAEQKIELLKQCFVKYYEENRTTSKSTAPVLSDDFDESNDVHSSSPVARADGEPIKKKKKKRDLDLRGRKRTKEMAENTDELSEQPSTSPAVSEMETDGLKLEVKDEKPCELLLNTVIDKSDPFMLTPSTSQAPSGPSVSNGLSSVSPRKRKKTEPGSSPRNGPNPLPPLRVIPSVLLMENPSQLEGQPAKTNVAADTPISQEDIREHVGRQLEGLDTVDDVSKMLHFEFDRKMDMIRPLTEVDVINAVKKDGTLRGRWINVVSMKRSGDVISGRIKFPDKDSRLKTMRKGISWNGFQASLTPICEVEYHRSFTEDSISTHPGTSSFESSSQNPEDEFWSPSIVHAPEFLFVDGIPVESKDARSPQSRERRFSQPWDDTGASSSRERCFSGPRDDIGTLQSSDGRFSQSLDDTSTTHSGDTWSSPESFRGWRAPRSMNHCGPEGGRAFRRGGGRGRGRGVGNRGGGGGSRGGTRGKGGEFKGVGSRGRGGRGHASSRGN